MADARKTVCFLAILLVFPFINMPAADEPDPFAWENNRVSADDVVAEADETITEGKKEQGIKADENYMSAMTDVSNSQEGVEQQAAAAEGVTAKEAPTAVETQVDEEQQSMLQSTDTQIKEKEMTKEQIEQDVKTLYAEGQKYYRIEDYEGAAEIWERILQNYPTARDLFEIRYSMANAYEYSKQYDKAIVQYQKVLAERPKHELALEAQYRLAACYMQLERWPFSLEIYRDIIRRAPSKKDSIRAYLNMAQLYIKQEKYKKAETIFRNIKKYYPGTLWEIQASFQLAAIYTQTQRYKTAINEYKLIKFKFKDTEWAPRAAMAIGDTYKVQGDLKNAKEAYSRVLYEYYKDENYTRQAEEKIRALKNYREIENRAYDR